ncbi:hypothetical protein GWI33_021952 [Rhynchophorus ferrugineus]|uniref:KIF-binding protein n=1 Tax=Rhynchophorus ferrugineus TaxID=354439 RepID=A0A834IRD0_RHYFE|nr:hypothetical protein GWI33_021952 [Rhynchophorus ferrugineus]
MTINKEAFVDLQEKYEKVIKLLLEGPKTDPENEPFLSKYSARQILIGMKANIENLMRTHSADTVENTKLTAMYGTVHLYLGMVAIDTEESSSGEKHLEKCRELLEPHENLPEVILIVLNMYNQFGILWSLRDPEKSKSYLEKAETLYNDFKKSGIVPIDISDLFHKYLRQLEMNDYEPIDWALNSATLSQFFMEKCGFKQARHHLAASSYILDKYKREEIDIDCEHNDEFDAKLETFNHRSADVARCWTKYGIFLLSKSKERLLAHTEDIDERCQAVSDLALIKLTDDMKVTAADLQNLSFSGIDVTKYEEQISDQFILHLGDAKKVFLKTQDWIKKAQDYYNLNTLASDYIEIILDQSQLYLNLLFFDDNQDNQAKLHKRRIDLLEYVINNINSQYYMSYCRQIWFELGQSYSDIIDIKLEKLRETKDRPKPQALNKVNVLVEKSIRHYENFLSSFKANVDEREKILDDAEKAFLRAYFHVAALYGRYITLDKLIIARDTQKHKN